MGTRLVDIAAEAGVSEATVSRVLNGRGGVNEATRRSVLEIARRRGRLAPKAPAVSEETTVGAIVPDLENPVFGLWLERIEANLHENGAALLVGMRARTPEREREAIDRLLLAGAAGVIVVSGFHARDEAALDAYRDLARAGIPLVLVNGVREDLEAAFVSSDDAHAISASLAHLQELGHETVGLAVGDEHTWPVRRKVAAFERSGPGSHRPIAFTDFTYAGGFEAAIELVRQGASAIVCGSDVMAAGALEGVRSLGLSVPADVSVIGFDDVPWAALTAPALTTVRQSVDQMARAAARAALSGGEDSRRPTRTELEVKPQLIVRASTAAAPRAVTVGAPRTASMDR
ncbi:LacI family DNA-binding transcriptional regulator [Brachybacterium endophyticum]|uniref:LacI family DNA-binding transcriptional regulator n=1 Tax=Brachybacterium endophyticum TaxID=2182385 RepID=UPI001F0B854B|nr:LacI family DNA-binding transcriptional regulator [Brachybacterium endophyticum]